VSANRHRIGGKIEDAANACDDCRQTPEIWKAYGGPQAVFLNGIDDQHPVLAANRDRAGIPAARHRLDAWYRPRLQERQNRFPVVGKLVAEL